MYSGVSPTVMKGATSCFQGVWVMSGFLVEFKPELILNDVEDLIDRKVQAGQGDGVFSFHYHQGSVLLGCWGLMPPCASSSCRFEDSRARHVKQPFWSAFCLA